VVLEDDSETMIRLVGKRRIPILVKDDGQPMLESMDMVALIDGVGEPILTGPQYPAVSAWADSIVDKTVPLTMPRYPLLGLPEFGTVAARDHYIVRKRKKLGDFVELRAQTPGELPDAQFASCSYRLRDGRRRVHICHGPDHWDYSATSAILSASAAAADRKPVLVQQNNRCRTPFFCAVSNGLPGGAA
jgi:hypothetical protein